MRGANGDSVAVADAVVCGCGAVNGSTGREVPDAGWGRRLGRAKERGEQESEGEVSGEDEKTARTEIDLGSGVGGSPSAPLQARHAQASSSQAPGARRLGCGAAQSQRAQRPIQ